MVGKSVVICFVPGEDWKTECITGTLKSLDDDLVQIEVGTTVILSIGDTGASGGEVRLQTLFIPWAAIRSMEPVK